MIDNRKEARRKAGYPTAKAYADAIGWHASSVRNVEGGFRKPPKWYDMLLGLLIKEHEIKVS